MPDVFQLLMEDHREVEQLFAKFEDGGDPDVAMRICEELTVHSTLEEELIYPLYRSKVDPGGADEARREHQEAKDLIVRIEAAGDGDQLKELVQTLKEAVQHHVEEEETELFPKMQSAIPDITDSLGLDVVARKEELLAGVAEDRSIGLAPSTMGQKPTASPVT